MMAAECNTTSARTQTQSPVTSSSYATMHMPCNICSLQCPTARQHCKPLMLSTPMVTQHQHHQTVRSAKAQWVSEEQYLFMAAQSLQACMLPHGQEGSCGTASSGIAPLPTVGKRPEQDMTMMQRSKLLKQHLQPRRIPQPTMQHKPALVVAHTQPKRC